MSSSDDSSSDEDYDDGELRDRDGVVILMSKAYCNVIEERGPSWSDVSSFIPEWHPCEGYTIFKPVGHGRFSTVYLARSDDHSKVALKVLVPVDIKRYVKEIKILQNLQGHPNIVRLIDLHRDPSTGICSLAFEWAASQKWRELYSQFSLADIKFYMRELLTGLDYAHSCGIIHRDLKPDNVAIDFSEKRLRILDWGLAEFYRPGQKLNPHAGTKAFMAPELLIGYNYANYGIDIWAAGLIFMLMLFKSFPFPRDDSETEQLFVVAKIIGGQAFLNLLSMCEIAFRKDWIHRLRGIKGNGFEKVVQAAPEARRPPEAVDLLMKMMKYDFRFRITAREALNHPFFGEASA
jgi:casein kinase II subunit alpha